MGNVGGTFNLGYFDGGTRGDAPGATNRGEWHCPAIKKLSKNPLKLRLVREQGNCKNKVTLKGDIER